MNSLPVANNVEEVCPAVFRWEAYSPEHRVRLTSHAFLCEGRLTVFDPIELGQPALDSILSEAESVQVFLTSENHFRATEFWRTATGAQISSLVASGFDKRLVAGIPEGTEEWQGFELRELPGGPGGESVVVEKDCGFGFGGDAIVNLPDRQLEILPEKYCSDRRKLVDSIRRLWDLDYLFTAHGEPVGPYAGKLVAELE